MDRHFLEEQKQFFIETLLELQRDLDLKWTGEQGFQGDEIDAFEAEKERVKILRFKKRSSAFLRKIKRALKKIESHCYGECEECGAEIAMERLRARPTAELCIDCKEEQEKIENQTYKQSAKVYELFSANSDKVNPDQVTKAFISNSGKIEIVQ
ncbi:MAG: TraR/DksA C4-type zinc finger protein [Halobacteriovoraceae bacterium]|nr:TraR/DksA C4-type zinc finger protein [Halobacteriovoraceae bacterium]MCB9095600.1 TraR/DksA C4-type zinc finger protein [Halobacteriovoraceae bacterium]